MPKLVKFMRILGHRSMALVKLVGSLVGSSLKTKMFKSKTVLLT